ncbi:expressed unknown protein [Seminavis robusta]|uniref:Uncharacterized protein n=1 Tax=Seminavis robusta TaxID=568900 RepID=A0A9N8DZV2_9STRA|nr:expressed unknown protein [Seminavis robusta]|eukprot:Sro510_g157250.1 n/a (295) ;mRNA; r:32203-33087
MSSDEESSGSGSQSEEDLSDDETESEGSDDGESSLGKEFLEFTNYRLLPGESCHCTDVVAAFRLFYDKYKSVDSLPDEEIEGLLNDWNDKYAKAKNKDGVYEGFQLNPKFLEKGDKKKDKDKKKDDKKKDDKKDKKKDDKKDKDKKDDKKKDDKKKDDKKKDDKKKDDKKKDDKKKDDKKKDDKKMIRRKMTRRRTIRRKMTKRKTTKRRTTKRKMTKRTRKKTKRRIRKRDSLQVKLDRLLRLDCISFSSLLLILDGCVASWVGFVSTSPYMGKLSRIHIRGTVCLSIYLSVR